jgi:hypothetical protein
MKKTTHSVPFWLHLLQPAPEQYGQVANTFTPCRDFLIDKLKSFCNNLEVRANAILSPSIALGG